MKEIKLPPVDENPVVEAAWQDGYSTSETLAQETIDEKDAFIEQQSGIIQELMKVLDMFDAWGAISDELRHKLADYV